MTKDTMNKPPIDTLKNTVQELLDRNRRNLVVLDQYCLPPPADAKSMRTREFVVKGEGVTVTYKPTRPMELIEYAGADGDTPIAATNDGRFAVYVTETEDRPFIRLSELVGLYAASQLGLKVSGRREEVQAIDTFVGTTLPKATKLLDEKVSELFALQSGKPYDLK